MEEWIARAIKVDAGLTVVRTITSPRACTRGRIYHRWRHDTSGARVCTNCGVRRFA